MKTKKSKTEIDCIIIKSNSKKEPNWSGKEFSNLPAKVYQSFEDATTALYSYWFSEFSVETDNREIRIIPLSESKKRNLLSTNSIRF